MNYLMNLFGSIAALGLLVNFVMIPAIWFIVGPHFQKILNVKYDPLDAMDDFPKLGRAGRYSVMIAFGNGMKNSLSRMTYGDHDFRKDARLIDKIISFIAWYAFALGLVATVLYGLCWLIIKIMSLA